MKKYLTILLSICALFLAQVAFALDAFQGQIFSNAGAPSSGTSEVQTVTWNNFAAGSITLSFKGKSVTVVATGAESNAALDTAIQNALQGLATIGSGGATVVTSGTTNRVFTITFAGNLVKLDVAQITSTVTAGTSVDATTTPGVTATGRGEAGKGALLIDTTNTKLYINTGTSNLNITWTVVGTQT